MHFQVHHEHRLEEVRDIFGHDIVPEHDAFWWTLEKKEGTVCQSAGEFHSEASARSDIAKAKTSFRATARLKVVSPE